MNKTGEDFAFETIEGFDKHINLSIPMYGHIWSLIYQLSTYFITDNTVVYDLGCSTGKGLYEVSKRSKGENVKYIGYDIADNLLDVDISPEIIKYKNDITDVSVKFPNASLILSIFTIQFIDPKHKMPILRKVYEGLNDGGAFILAEKVYLNDGKTQDIFTFSYYDFKRKSFSPEEILGKQTALRKIMKNNTADELEEMLKKVGFKRVQPFFQALNFVGWLCIK